MFGKKKKEPKIEQVFGDKKDENEPNPQETNLSEEDAKLEETANAALEEFKSDEPETEDSDLTPVQKEKYEKLGNVREKISKILQSSNIEIVDENIGDEYESETGGDNEKQQQDYDSLKALFGSKDKSKAQELTLTIDDFDYTYTGQYIDEYDLMHMKGIKKIRLQRKHSKHLKRIIIAACLILVVGLGAFLGYYFTRETPVYLKAVSLNQTEHDYYIYENFDYTGLYFIAEYSNGRVEKIPLSRSYLVESQILGNVNKQGDIQFTGGSYAELPFSYQGFSVTYKVNIKNKTIKGISSIYAKGLFTLRSGSYVSEDYLKVLFDYGEDYGKEFVSLSTQGLKLVVDGTEYTYTTDAGNKKLGGFKLTKDITLTSNITIKYQSFSVELTNGTHMVDSLT